MSDGISMIAAERLRQVEDEGWSSEHDDGHVGEVLARAAACYAMPEPIFVRRDFHGGVMFSDVWPGWRDKRSELDRVALLVKAGALIAAEIDRVTRREIGAR